MFGQRRRRWVDVLQMFCVGWESVFAYFGVAKYASRIPKNDQIVDQSKWSELNRQSDMDKSPNNNDHLHNGPSSAL